MFFREEVVADTKWLEMALRISWAAVCFGKPFLSREIHTCVVNGRVLLRHGFCFTSTFHTTITQVHHNWHTARQQQVTGKWSYALVQMYSLKDATVGINVRCYQWKSHRPAGREGKATDLSFFSSAAERQFLTVFSSWSSHFSEPHWGTLQWITKRAAIPVAWLTATTKHQTD